MKPPNYVNKLRFGLNKPCSSLDYNSLLSHAEFEPSTLATLTFHRTQATTVLASIVAQGSVVPPREIQVRSPHNVSELVSELENTLQHWIAFTDVYIANRERLRFPGIPTFLWQSGMDGKQYSSTAMYFETIMLADLLASVYFNAAMDYMVERMSTNGFPTQNEADLLLAAYRVLRDVCSETIQKYTEVDEAHRPPECSLNICIAKMETCMLVLHHGFFRVQSVRTIELTSQDSSSGAIDDYIPFSMPTEDTGRSKATVVEENTQQYEQTRDPPMYYRNPSMGNTTSSDIDWKYMGDTLQLTDVVRMARWTEITVDMIKARLIVSNVNAWQEGIECIRMEAIFLKICATDWLLCTVNQGGGSAIATASVLFNTGEDRAMFSLEDRRILRAFMASYVTTELYPRVRQRTSASSLLGRRSAWDDNTCTSDILWAVNRYEDKVTHDMGILAVKGTDKANINSENPAAERMLEEAKVAVLTTKAGITRDTFFAATDDRFNKIFKTNFYDTLTGTYRVPFFLRI